MPGTSAPTERRCTPQWSVDGGGGTQERRPDGDASFADHHRWVPVANVSMGHPFADPSTELGVVRSRDEQLRVGPTCGGRPGAVDSRVRTARRTSATPEAMTMIQPGVSAPSRSDGRRSPPDENTEPSSPPATAIPGRACSLSSADGLSLLIRRPDGRTPPMTSASRVRVRNSRRWCQDQCGALIDAPTAADGGQQPATRQIRASDGGAGVISPCCPSGHGLPQIGSRLTRMK